MTSEHNSWSVLSDCVPEFPWKCSFLVILGTSELLLLKSQHRHQSDYHESIKISSQAVGLILSRVIHSVTIT